MASVPGWSIAVLLLVGVTVGAMLASAAGFIAYRRWRVRDDYQSVKGATPGSNTEAMGREEAATGKGDTGGGAEGARLLGAAGAASLTADGGV